MRLKQSFFFGIGHFLVDPCLFQSKAKCKAIYMKIIFILVQIKLINTRKICI